MNEMLRPFQENVWICMAFLCCCFSLFPIRKCDFNSVSMRTRGGLFNALRDTLNGCCCAIYSVVHGIVMSVTATTLFMKIKKYLQVLMALVLGNHKQSKCVNLRLDGEMMTYSRLFSCFFPSNSFFESKILNKTANTTIAISKQISHKRNQWKYNYSVNRLQQIKFSSSHILSLSLSFPLSSQSF